MQRCRDLRPCLVTVNIGVSKETEDKAAERRPMPHSLHEVCVILHQKCWVDWVMLKRQQITPNYLLCFTLIKKSKYILLECVKKVKFSQ